MRCSLLRQGKVLALHPKAVDEEHLESLPLFFIHGALGRLCDL